MVCLLYKHSAHYFLDEPWKNTFKKLKFSQASLIYIVWFLANFVMKSAKIFSKNKNNRKKTWQNIYFMKTTTSNQKKKNIT